MLRKRNEEAKSKKGRNEICLEEINETDKVIEHSLDER